MIYLLSFLLTSRKQLEELTLKQTSNRQFNKFLSRGVSQSFYFVLTVRFTDDFYGHGVLE